MYPLPDWWHVKVRIKETPREREVDGVRMDIFRAGSIHEVSASIGTWLVAQGYADLEMRRASRNNGHGNPFAFNPDGNWRGRD